MNLVGETYFCYRVKRECCGAEIKDRRSLANVSYVNFMS